MTAEIKQYEQLTTQGESLARTILEEGKYPIYGANLLPGHKDASAPICDNDIKNFEQDFLRSHCLPFTQAMPEDVVVSMLPHKIQSISLGESGVSLDLLEQLFQLQREGWTPELKSIPSPSYSYSSGDVAIAAHWARQVIEKIQGVYDIQPGELMALINGNFVQLAYAEYVYIRVIALFTQLAFQTIQTLHYIDSGTNPNRIEKGLNEDCTNYMERLWAAAPKATYVRVQHPVSIRASKQVVATLATIIDEFGRELRSLAKQTSANPMFKSGLNFPVSSDSFLTIKLGIRTGALMDAVAICARTIQARSSFLLAGVLRGDSEDLATDSQPLGLIQHPKVMMALLSKVIRSANSRVGAESGSTSHGVEDLWNNGLQQLEALNEAIGLLGEMAELEKSILNRAYAG